MFADGPKTTIPSSSTHTQDGLGFDPEGDDASLDATSVQKDVGMTHEIL